MTIASSPGHTDSRLPGPAWQAFLPGTAGLAYVLAWIGGLAARPVNLALDASAAQTAASYRAHPAEAVAQYLLVEGLAGLLLGVVLVQALRAARDRAGRWPAGPAVLSAIAVIASVTQCVIGLFATAAATSGHVASSGTLSDLVNRLDGVKMLALAAVAVWLAAGGAARPRWLRAACALLGLAMIASGYAYLTLTSALGWTAYVSGPLLLLCVAGTGVVLTRARRHLTE